MIIRVLKIPRIPSVDKDPICSIMREFHLQLCLSQQKSISSGNRVDSNLRWYHISGAPFWKIIRYCVPFVSNLVLRDSRNASVVTRKPLSCFVTVRKPALFLGGIGVVMSIGEVEKVLQNRKWYVFLQFDLNF